ncbi:MAG: RNA methyltransferase [Bacteroidota bacterium]
MLSKNKIKYIRSLRTKKYRDEYKQFICEGNKIVRDLLNSRMKICSIIATNSWLESNPEVINSFKNEIINVSTDELSKISLLKNTPDVLAVVDYSTTKVNINEIINKLSIVLDNVQDPGNLGTIIRTADWFGIENIFCSNDSVDVYNPKVVQASMGAIARINVHYVILESFLIKYSNESKIPVYGTYLEGNNIFQQNLTKNGLIVFGNEGSGISAKFESLIKNKLYIPNYPSTRKTSESLNVATAVSVVCSEFRRRNQ